MTDKVQKIREKVERLQKRAEHYFDISLTENDRQFWLGESNVLTLIGKYIDTMQEEPKECMYSKDNYTDEDRKALCDGCEEKCEFNKKDEIKSVHAQHTTISSSLNDYLCKAYSALYKGNGGRLSFARLQNMAIDITEWQKEQMMAKAVDVTIAIPYPNGDGGYSQIVDSKEALPFGDNMKVLVIKEG